MTLLEADKKVCDILSVSKSVTFSGGSLFSFKSAFREVPPNRRKISTSLEAVIICCKIRHKYFQWRCFAALLCLQVRFYPPLKVFYVIVYSRRSRMWRRTSITDSIIHEEVNVRVWQLIFKTSSVNIRSQDTFLIFHPFREPKLCWLAILGNQSLQGICL